MQFPDWLVAVTAGLGAVLLGAAALAAITAS
jgi:hypothetical protein